MAVLLTVGITFIGSANCSVSVSHMNMTVGTDLLPPLLRRASLFLSELLMGVIAIFMVVWGLRLVQTTWGNSVDQFPWLWRRIFYRSWSAGAMMFFVVERLTIGPPPRDGADAHVPVVILMDIAVLLLSMCFFFAIGMPIAYALALSSLVGALWIDLPVGAVMQQFASGVGKVSMLTIPFFVLAGAIMAEGGMARRLVDFAAVVVGFTRMRGGLSQVNILATTIMSGISGSSVADTSAIGSVMIPQMAAKGYPRVFATNVTISASLQAIIIPPSHNSVIYSLATGGVVSITSLFLAGVIPGLLLGFSLMLLCLFYAYRDKHPKGEPVPIRQAVRMLGDAVWGIVTLVIVLGGILTGVFTPIEAGAVACVWAFFVTMFVYRDYKWSELPLLVYRTLQTVAMVLTLVATASCFGYVAALMQMPAKMTEFFVAISSNKYVLLMWLNIMLLVLGTALDLAPLLLICTPILLPVVKSFGIDPVHFGIVMLLNLGIGLLTPPVGTTLFVGCAIGKVSVDEVMRGIWPFYYVMFTVLMIVTYVPWLSLALPRAFGF